MQLRKEEVRTLELVWMNEETQAKLRKCEEERTFLLNVRWGGGGGAGEPEHPNY